MSNTIKKLTKDPYWQEEGSMATIVKRGHPLYKKMMENRKRADADLWAMQSWQNNGCMSGVESPEQVYDHDSPRHVIE